MCFAQKDSKGFTLIEVLVAMVVAGLVLTIFFQLLSAGIRLEHSSIRRTQDVLDMEQVFSEIISRDIQDPEFEWQKEEESYEWTLSIEPVETLKTHLESEESIQLSSELYRYVFQYKTKDKRQWTLVRYVQHDPHFFTEDFKQAHFP